jgi:hypothetical protein
MDEKLKKAIWQQLLSELPDDVFKNLLATKLFCDKPDESFKEYLRDQVFLDQGEMAIPDDLEAVADRILRTDLMPNSSNVEAMLYAMVAEIVADHDQELGEKLYLLSNQMLTRSKEKIPLYYRAHRMMDLYENPEEYAKYRGEELNKATASLIKDLLDAFWDSEGNLRSQDAKRAADVRHSKPGGSREKRDQIRQIWASGKYSSRDICAEQECASLNMSFASARKALRNTPNPT